MTGTTRSSFPSEQKALLSFSAHLEKYSPEKASEICGVPPEEIERVARLYATSNVRPFFTHTRNHGAFSRRGQCEVLGKSRHAHRPYRKRSSGVNPLRGQNNVQGHCDMGALPNVFPGYQVVTDESIRKKFEAAWNAELSDKIGYTIPEMMDRLIDGTVKGIFIFGENPVLADPNTHTRRSCSQVGGAFDRARYPSSLRRQSSLTLRCRCEFGLKRTELFEH